MVISAYVSYKNRPKATAPKPAAFTDFPSYLQFEEGTPQCVIFLGIAIARTGWSGGLGTDRTQPIDDQGRQEVTDDFVVTLDHLHSVPAWGGANRVVPTGARRLAARYGIEWADIVRDGGMSGQPLVGNLAMPWHCTWLSSQGRRLSVSSGGRA